MFRAALVLALLAAGCTSPDEAAHVAPPVSSTPTPPTPTGLAVEIDSLVDRSRPGLDVAVPVPQITGVSGAAAPNALMAANLGLRDSVEAFVAAIAPTEPPPGNGAGGAPSVYVTDGEVETTLFQDDLYSGVVRVVTYSGGAHPNTYTLGLMRDLRTGAPIALARLFRPGAPYLDTLAAWVQRGVIAQLAERGGLTPAEAREAVVSYNTGGVRLSRPAVTLTPDGLRVHVAPYEAMAYAAGLFEIDVPFAALDGMLAETAPLARLRR